MSDLRAKLGERMRQRRKALGMTQLDLGSAVGVDITSINRIEKGSTWPSFGTLEAIAKALGCTPDALIGAQDTSLEPTLKQALEIIDRELGIKIPLPTRPRAQEPELPAKSSGTKKWGEYLKTHSKKGGGSEGTGT